ncbi:MAG TPA: folylpolyglutamate synthase/dihydrofolate synthase family protein [Candidatus Paceibacterota bacterium]|nr:folylpolyglutamate synthase/dihydrofolate synthase family protein [Candidatus Paceibacterota bacterium]
MSHPNYRQAIEFLYRLQWFGARLGLENPLKLARLLGNPQKGLRFIHIAGTNGKGSTCAVLESIYRAAGHRVGLFTSPHLVSFRERIQVNRRLISQQDVVRLVDAMRPVLKEFSEPDHPTFFEVVTVMALRYFAERKCDLVIWETGLGGRLDATNIVMPIASVITNVQYDHQKWLGETLADIASEKAGIIKPGTPVIAGVDGDEAFAVIQKSAAEKQSPLIRVDSDIVRNCGDVLKDLPLLGDYQRKNAALALAAVEALRDRLPVTPEQIRTGVSTVSWPGRMQVHTTASGQRILLDGAHNLDGAKAFVGSLKQIFPSERAVFVMGVLQDKDWREICRIFSAITDRLILVPVQNGRTTDPAQLEIECKAANPNASITICPSLGDALKAAASEPFIAITGSLYLVGEAMELLDLGPESPSDERGLNDWGGKPRS